MSNSLKKEIPVLLVILIPCIYLMTVWNHLPEQLPTHFNIHGEADSYSSKYFFPIMNFVLYFVLLILPKIDTKKENYEIFQSSYFKIRLSLAIFFSAIFSLTITKALIHDFPLQKGLSILFLLLFIALGNYMANIKQNWFIGIRTPWTMDNETVWRKTHSLAGKLWFFGSLAGVLFTLLADIQYVFPVTIGLILILAVIPVIYSMIIYKKFETER